MLLLSNNSLAKSAIEEHQFFFLGVTVFQQLRLLRLFFKTDRINVVEGQPSVAVLRRSFDD